MDPKPGKALLRALPLSAAVLSWGFFAMLYLEAFFTPLKGFGRWITPWRQLFSPEAGDTLEDKMAFMSGLFDRSVAVGNIGLSIMVVSFVVLVVYATAVIQQKQRRARENELLLMKNMEIARRNEFIRYISATIGHEFKNNLGRIKRRLALLDLPDAARKHIDVNLEKLFADINIFKRISDEREAGLIYFEKTDLAGMVDSVASQYSDLIAFDSKVELKHPVIFSSFTLLRTVFENIFDNAVKYKKPGQEKARVSLACTMDMDGMRRYVSLSIRDEGVGMDERQAEACFYKGMGSGEGWGEGLYFTKYVVGLHAGKIKIGKEYTAPGVGTEVIINLPFVEEEIDV